MILFVNYTGDSYHWGCHATSMAIYRRLAAHDDVAVIPVQDVHRSQTPDIPGIQAFAGSDTYAAQNPAIAAKLDRASHVVVNGEGTLHGASSPGARGLLGIIAAARHRGLPVSLINHSLFPNDFAQESNAVDQDYAAILSGLNWVSVRESQSAGFYRAHGIACVDAFDCLPLHCRDLSLSTRAERDRDAPVILAGAVNFSNETLRGMLRTVGDVFRDHRLVFLYGSPGANALEDDAFARDLAGHGRVEVVNCPDFGIFMDHLRRGRMLISGRFHYNIAAVHAGTPLISFDSNTPKNAAMLTDVGYGPAVLSHAQAASDDFRHLLERALENPGGFASPLEQDELVARAERNFGFLEAVPRVARAVPERLAARISRLFADGQVLQVIETYESAAPDEVAALSAHLLVAVAKSYRSGKRFARAVDLCRQAVAQAPDNVSAHANLIVSLNMAGCPGEGCEAAEVALARFPGEFGILVPAAVAAQDVGRFYLAVARYQEILAHKPAYLAAHLRLIWLYANVFQDFPAATRHARAAVELAPDDLHLHRLLGEQLLRQGEYAAGFPEFRRRLESPAFLKGKDNRDGRLPFWAGEPVAGKLLVQTEAAQGVGFELFCAGFLPLLHARGIDTVCEASAKLVPMLRAIHPGEFVPLDSKADSAGRTDVSARANFTTLCCQLWREVGRRPLPDLRVPVRTDRPLRIGISWQTANPVTGEGRGIPLDDWAVLMDGVRDATWVNLQHGPVARDLDAFSARHGHRIERGQGDFIDDNAALIETLRSVDVVVSIDNSTVFYADTLGKPVFVIPPVAPYWIWGTAGSRTPWVPYARIVRRSLAVPARDCLKLVGKHLGFSG